MIVQEMTKQETAELVLAKRLGRLACTRGGQPYIVPITYSASGNNLYGFSMIGRKTEWMRDNPLVCVEVDDISDARHWRSVVIDGIYEELTDTAELRDERDKAWSLLQEHANWWEPGDLKPASDSATTHLFYRIRIESMTGRKTAEAG